MTPSSLPPIPRIIEAGFVGRQRELESLRQFADQVRRGHGGVLLVEGEAGIGKTRLLDEALSEVGSGFVVIRARAQDVAVDAPAAALLSALAAMPVDARQASALTGADRFGAALRGDAIPDATFRAADYAVEAVEDLAARSPTLVVFDDAQWADPATIAALRGMARRASTMAIGVIAAARPVPRNRALAALIDDLRGGAGAPLILGPLPDDDVAALCRETLDGEPPVWLEERLRAAGGNPFLLRVLVRAVAGMTTSERAGVVRLPDDANDLVLRQLSSLDDEALEILQLAALLGAQFDVVQLATVASRSLRAVLAPLERLRRAGIIRRDGDDVAFAHELVRDAIYTDIPDESRRRLHLEVAATLREGGAPRALVGWHQAAATSDDDSAAVNQLCEAAALILEAAPEVAVGILRRAVGIDPQSPRAVPDLAEALSRAGAFREAGELAEAALEWVVGAEPEARLRVLLAFTAMQRGRGVGEAARELEALGSDPLARADVRREMFTQSAIAYVVSGGFVDAARVAAVVANDSVASRARAQAIGVLAWVHDFSGDFETARAYADRLSPAADDRAESDSFAAFFAGMIWIDLDDFRQAERCFGMGTSSGLAPGWLRSMQLQALGAARYYEGRWDEAVAELEAGNQLAAEAGARGATPLALAVLASISAMRGDFERAAASLDEGDRFIAAGAAPLGLDWLALARAQLLRLRGNPSEALTYLSGAWDLDLLLGLRNDLRTLGPPLVAIAHECGDTPRVQSTTAVLLEHAATTGRDVERAAALVAKATSDPIVAREALDIATRLTRPHERAELLGALVAPLLQSGRRADGYAALRDALGIYDTLGATAAREALRATARGLGLRTPKARQSGPTSGWDALSATEWEIVGLVCDGLSNRKIGESLFLSGRTIESHVSHVFTKVGVSSRVELAAAATPVLAARS